MANVKLTFIDTARMDIIALSVTPFQSKIRRPLKQASRATMAANDAIDPTSAQSSSFHDFKANHHRTTWDLRTFACESGASRSISGASGEQAGKEP